jgi:hypothetical protein
MGNSGKSVRSGAVRVKEKGFDEKSKSPVEKGVGDLLGWAAGRRETHCNSWNDSRNEKEWFKDRMNDKRRKLKEMEMP